MGMRRFSRGAACLVATACLGACATLGGGPSVLDVAGTYTGYFEIEGQPLDGTLTLTQAGTVLEATFSAPAMGLTSVGGGTIDGRDIRLQMAYNMECPGTAVVVGSVDEDGVYSGTVEATDCTGTVGGGFRFRPSGGE